MKLNNKDIEDYVLVMNLLDGDVYTYEDIAFLADVDVETVKSIVKGEYHIDDKDAVNIKSKIVGDGSGVIYCMGIQYSTVVDGKGFRNSVYSAKCNIFCKGCHNRESWDIRNGFPITVNELAKRLSSNGLDVTFTGGECLLQAKAFTRLAEIIKNANKNIWLYSGRTFDTIVKDPNKKKLLEYIDVLVDGGFVEELRDTTIPFRGSTNQRVIDVKKSLESNNVVLYND